jgi:hypothetical protein
VVTHEIRELDEWAENSRDMENRWCFVFCDADIRVYRAQGNGEELLTFTIFEVTTAVIRRTASVAG